MMRLESFNAEYGLVDRKGWPPGPWDGEPDKLTWVDPATGLDALIHRNHLGAWCGYVGVPNGHPYYGKHYDGIDLVNVHGGLTYAQPCGEHICHVAEPGRPSDVWWLGFDCLHMGDVAPGMPTFAADRFDWPGPPRRYWSLRAVMEETTGLAAQLRQVGLALGWSPPWATGLPGREQTR